MNMPVEQPACWQEITNLVNLSCPVIYADILSQKSFTSFRQESTSSLNSIPVKPICPARSISIGKGPVNIFIFIVYHIIKSVIMAVG